jgi:nucleotidyltransferase substrate binding protein (TIGR01987 family)
MAQNPDVRWRQRFENFQGAFAQLTKAVALARQRPLSELEQQGLIQAFEFTHELAWNVLKDYLEAQGYVDIIGSRGATRTAFQNGLVEDGEAWMDMIKARNRTTHTYNCKVAESIAKDILNRFEPAFAALQRHFQKLANLKESG